MSLFPCCIQFRSAEGRSGSKRQSAAQVPLSSGQPNALWKPSSFLTHLLLATVEEALDLLLVCSSKMFHFSCTHLCRFFPSVHL